MEKALERDAHTCRCCGFKSLKFQRVVPGWIVKGANDDYLTLCRFCELCFLLDQTVSGGGVLIWLPELSQADLNHLLRAIYVARAPTAEDEEHPMAGLATRALDALMARRADAKKRLGSDDPFLLATVMIESLDDKEYASRAERLDGIRLLPLDRWLVKGRRGDADQFPRVIKYWISSQGPFAKLPPAAWQPLFDSVTGPGVTVP